MIIEATPPTAMQPQVVKQPQPVSLVETKSHKSQAWHRGYSTRTSARSGRQHKAWGEAKRSERNPRIQPKTKPARAAGDSRIVKQIARRIRFR